MQTLGQFLHNERIAKDISISELAAMTKIPAKSIHCIETGDMARLPCKVITKGFVRSYAKAVGIEEKVIVQRFESVAEPYANARPFVASPNPESKRYSIAIASAVLAVLATLAWSIASQPRQRVRPVELSSVAPMLVVNSSDCTVG